MVEYNAVSDEKRTGRYEGRCGSQRSASNVPGPRALSTREDPAQNRRPSGTRGFQCEYHVPLSSQTETFISIRVEAVLLLALILSLLFQNLFRELPFFDSADED